MYSGRLDSNLKCTLRGAPLNTHSHPPFLLRPRENETNLLTSVSCSEKWARGQFTAWREAQGRRSQRAERAQLARGLRAGCQRRSGPWNSRQPGVPACPQAPTRPPPPVPAARSVWTPPLPPRPIRGAPVARCPWSSAVRGGRARGCASAPARPPGRDGSPAAVAAAQLLPAGLRLPARPKLGARVQAREADRQGGDSSTPSPRQGGWAERGSQPGGAQARSRPADEPVCALAFVSACPRVCGSLEAGAGLAWVDARVCDVLAVRRALCGGNRCWACSAVSWVMCPGYGCVVCF